VAGAGGHADQDRFKRHARRLFRLSATRRHRTGGFSRKRDINIIDPEHGQLPRGVPLDGNVSGKVIAILLIEAERTNFIFGETPSAAQVQRYDPATESR
jgi:hypothetical protein